MPDHRNKLLAGVATAAFLGPFSQTVFMRYSVNAVLLSVALLLGAAALVITRKLSDPFGARPA